MRKIFNYIYWRIGIKLFHYSFIRNYMPDKMYLQNYFCLCMGYSMDFDNPKTFNEKLHWLKLYDRKPIYTTLVDKYAVKEWIKRNIAGDILTIPTITTYNSINEIDYSKLPKQFVMKCTHDSGSVIVCRDKGQLNINATHEIIEKCLKQNYYMLGREWPYKNVQHKILVEEFLGEDVKDYKFFCFGGKVKCFKIDFDRSTRHGANYYDRECHLLPFGEVVCPPDYTKSLTMPNNINEMIDIAEKISKKIDCCFERIDLYNIQGKIYFGEITFFPAGGHMKLTDPTWDIKLGSWIDIYEVSKS